MKRKNKFIHSFSYQADKLYSLNYSRYSKKALVARLPSNRLFTPVRFNNRCFNTGFSRSNLRFFGISRMTFRSLLFGVYYLVSKSSW